MLLMLIPSTLAIFFYPVYNRRDSLSRVQCDGFVTALPCTSLLCLGGVIDDAEQRELVAGAWAKVPMAYWRPN